METLSTAPWSFLLSPRGRRVPTKLHITEGDTGKHFPHGVLGVEPLPYPGTGNSGKHFPLVGRPAALKRDGGGERPPAERDWRCSAGCRPSDIRLPKDR